jgi:negative elongation factor C/D
MLISYFFEPNAKPNEEHKSKYLYLLSYACSVAESYKKSLRKSYNKDELKATHDCIEKAYQICLENKTSSELLGDLHELFVCIRCISASVGILKVLNLFKLESFSKFQTHPNKWFKWIELTILDPGYFKINTDASPVHLLILDEIVNVHQQLHDRVLNLLIKIFETNFHELDHLLQLQLKKTILDRMVHLLSRDHVIPVVSYINKCWKNQETDASLIRHFVIEILDMIGPPYSNEFISLFLPLVDNENINSSLKVDEEKAVKEFLAYCKDIQQ